MIRFGINTNHLEYTEGLAFLTPSMTIGFNPPPGIDAIGDEVCPKGTNCCESLGGDRQCCRPGAPYCEVCREEGCVDYNDTVPRFGFCENDCECVPPYNCIGNECN